MGTDRVGSLGDLAGRVVRRRRGLSPRMRALTKRYGDPRWFEYQSVRLSLVEALDWIDSLRRQVRI